MRKLLERLGLVGAKVNRVIHPMVRVTAIASDAGPAGWVDSKAPPQGRDSVPLGPQGPTEFAEAERRFREELPRLLQQGEKRGWWVVYSAGGLVEDAAEEGSLRQKYGQQIGNSYLLACIVSDPPEAEVTPNWFVTMVSEPNGVQ
jgi:hypothetical protein